MQRSVLSNSSKVAAAVVLALVGAAVISSTGCNNQQPTSPALSGSPQQVDQAMRQSAQNYADFRKNHPQGGTPGQAQQTPQQ